MNNLVDPIIQIIFDGYSQTTQIFLYSCIIPRYGFTYIFPNPPTTNPLMFCSFLQVSEHVTKSLTTVLEFIWIYISVHLSPSWQTDHVLAKVMPTGRISIPHCLFMTYLIWTARVILICNLILWKAICNPGLNFFFLCQLLIENFP